MVPKTLGKYQVLARVGRGGMGEVYKAWQPDLNRTVAIKTLLAGEQASEEFLQRLHREARMAAKLVHPNIVQIHDIGAEGNIHYIVMEYVEGRTLVELLEKKKLDTEKSLKIALSIARALQFAHHHKIIHRDIKPANVLITNDGRVCVLDFGLAKRLGDGPGVTASGIVLGTPHYMAPEQAFGAPEEVDTRADLYSLGATLYEMLTGQPPFDGQTVMAVLKKIQDEDPKPARISRSIDALLKKALAKDPARRFQTAFEMADTIKACLNGESRVYPSKRPRSVWIAAGSLAGALALGLGIFRANRASAPQPRPAEAPVEIRNRAAEDLSGFQRLLCEAASAKTLQRFLYPSLFRIRISEPPDLKGGEAFLAAALARHFEGKQPSAREKLKSAVANRSPAAQILFVRAHLDLWEIGMDPKTQSPLLAPLAEDLKDARESYLLPLRAIAAHLAGNAPAAWGAADQLQSQAPGAAETHLLRAILFQQEQKFDQALDCLGDAARLDPKRFDSAPAHAWLRWQEVLSNPAKESLDAVAMRKLLDKADPQPVVLLLRGALNALESRWDDAKGDLQEFSLQARLDSIYVNNSLLDAFVSAGPPAPSCRLLEAARDLQIHLGRREEAIDTAGLILIEANKLSEEEGKLTRRTNHLRLARLMAGGDAPRALGHLKEALELETPPQEIRKDEALEILHQNPDFEKLLGLYEDPK